MTNADPSANGTVLTFSHPVTAHPATADTHVIIDGHTATGGTQIDSVRVQITTGFATIGGEAWSITATPIAVTPVAGYPQIRPAQSGSVN